MINFHPRFEQLDAFVAGECEATLALMIAAHIDMCPLCREHSEKLNHLHSISALSDNPAVNYDGPVSHAGRKVSAPAVNAELDKLFNKIVQMPKAVTVPVTTGKSTIELDGKVFQLPRSLKRFANHTGNWSKLVGKLWQAPVDLGYMGKANFMYMEKGGRVPEHTHKGTEMTLVIDGQYNDGVADYDCGDFTLLDSSHKHVPFSDADEGCLVFTIVDKPLYFTSGLARLLNPFSHLFFK